MNEGGYSRLEKDFLGNERMVHYDGSGNMLGASDVVREPDGTIRVTNEPISPVEVEVVEPKKPEPIATPFAGAGQKDGIATNQVVMYSIAAFIATSILTFGVLFFLKSKGNDGGVRMDQVPIQRQTPQIDNRDSLPDSPKTDELPSDPRPRNDEQREDRPFDQTAPDSNMDDTRPRVNDNEPVRDAQPPNEDSVRPAPKPKKNKSDEPIDLRGDEGGKSDPPKKGDPTGDPLRGDDIH